MQIRGVRPFLSDKYDITKHPNYKYLSDYNKKNEFDIEKFVSTKLLMTPDDEVDTYDMSGIEQEAAGEEIAEQDTKDK